MSAPWGYRRLLVSLDLVRQAIVSGARCCAPADVPKDLRVVSVVMCDERTVDLLVASREFPQEVAPEEDAIFRPSYRRIDCGAARLQEVERQVLELRERFALPAAARGLDVNPRLEAPAPEEAVAALDAILELLPGIVEQAPADAVGPVGGG